MDDNKWWWIILSIVGVVLLIIFCFVMVWLIKGWDDPEMVDRVNAIIGGK